VPIAAHLSSRDAASAPQFGEPFDLVGLRESLIEPA
jgi:hypothetical protein